MARICDRKRHRVRKKSFLARGVSRRPWWDDRERHGKTRQILKREIDREIRSYE